MTRSKIFLIGTFSCFLVSACTQKPAPAQEQAAQANVEKKVYFLNLKNGDHVKSPLLVKFGVTGMQVHPAGQDMADTHSGHHHLLIDNAAGFVQQGQVIPMDAKHVHYGKGQLEDKISLEPGPHKLTLQFANGAHISYGSDMAASVSIIVDAPQK